MSDPSLAEAPPLAGPPPPIPVGAPHLGLTYRTVIRVLSLLFCVLFAAYIALAVFLAEPTDTQSEMIDKVGTAWWTTFSAMIGLVAGKSLE